MKGKTLDIWLHFYLPERSCRLQKLFCTDTDLTENAFSSVEREVYEVFIVGT